MERDLPESSEIEEYNKRIEEIDKAKFEIAKNINGIEQECESLESQLNKLTEQLGSLQLKKMEIEQEAASDLPAIRFSWSLYSNLSNIRWDYENAQVKGCKLNSSAHILRVTTIYLPSRSFNSRQCTAILFGSFKMFQILHYKLSLGPDIVRKEEKELVGSFVKNYIMCWFMRYIHRLGQNKNCPDRLGIRGAVWC